MTDIGEILKKWNDAKKKIDILEEKIKKYKVTVSKEMGKLGVDKINKDGYTISRRHQTRTTLSKDSVPADIWNQYSSRCSYDVFILTENK
jgi:hypothetical protein